MKKTVKKILGKFYYNLYKKHYAVSGNRALIYHAFGTKLEHDTYGISIDLELFDKHLKYLKFNHSVVECTSFKINENSVSITIDDGYKDNLEAVKLLTKYELPFTIFISTGLLNSCDYLDDEDVKELSRNTLCTIGSHTVNHKALNKLTYEQQYNELSESKKYLELLIGRDIKSCSLPYGLYNSDTKKIINDIGYKCYFSSKISLNLNPKSFELSRTEIIASDSVKELQRKILGYYDFR